MTGGSISVVIPAHNAAPFLAQALASVRAQTLPVHEIIVVDDGSTDETARLAEQAGVKVLRQAQAGAGAARNQGADAATGEWLTFLDADDLWHPEKLERQLAWMKSHPETDVLFGHGANFSVDAAGVRNQETSRPALLPGAALLRREFFLRRARFNTGVSPSEVIEWYLRLQDEKMRIAVLPELVLLRRLHATNTRRHGDGGRSVDLQLLRARIARQRDAGT